MPVWVTPHTFDSLEKEWEQLLRTSATDTLFLTPRWQRIWWEIFGERANLLLLAFHQDTTPLGIAPLMRQDGVLSFVGEPDLFDYHDFIVPREQEGPFYTHLVEYLATEEWKELHLTSLPEHSPTLTHLPRLAQAQEWVCHIEQEGVAPGLVLPQDWDGYLLGLTKKDRHELRRKHRRLQKQDEARHYVCSTPEAILECAEDLFSLMGLGRQEKSHFLTPQRQEFFRAVIQDLAEAEMLQLYFMEIDGERVAAALCFDYQDQRLLYNSGFDPKHAQLSVGLLLNAFSLKDAIEREMRYFDFLRGDEPYKYHLGGRDRRLHDLVITR